MRVYFGDPSRFDLPPCALAIGNFDGVHVGHQTMLAQLKAEASERQLPTALLTFEPHPCEFFAQGAPLARLSTLRDKLLFLRQLGTVDFVFVYRFNRGFSQLMASHFIDTVLIQQLKTRYLLTGDDFQFGVARGGSVSLLAQHTGFITQVMPTVRVAGERVSSSLVRQRLAAGDLSRVVPLLGRYYSLSGRVMHGRKLGRTLGFPTANVTLPHYPPALEGIFIVKADTSFGPFNGIASLGKNPTIADGQGYQLEVHLFDFAADLYGQRIMVHFLEKLRDEAHYGDLSQLLVQIRQDAVRAKTYLTRLQRERA